MFQHIDTNHGVKAGSVIGQCLTQRAAERPGSLDALRQSSAERLVKPRAEYDGSGDGPEQKACTHQLTSTGAAPM